MVKLTTIRYNQRKGRRAIRQDMPLFQMGRNDALFRDPSQANEPPRCGPPLNPTTGATVNVTGSITTQR